MIPENTSEGRNTWEGRQGRKFTQSKFMIEHVGNAGQLEFNSTGALRVRVGYTSQNPYSEGQDKALARLWNLLLRTVLSKQLLSRATNLPVYERRRLLLSEETNVRIKDQRCWQLKVGPARTKVVKFSRVTGRTPKHLSEPFFYFLMPSSMLRLHQWKWSGLSPTGTGNLALFPFSATTKISEQCISPCREFYFFLIRWQDTYENRVPMYCRYKLGTRLLLSKLPSFL